MKIARLFFVLGLAYLTLSAKKCKDDEPTPIPSGTAYVTTNGKTYNFTQSFVNNPNPHNSYTLTCWGYMADSTYFESLVVFPKKPSPGNYTIKAGPLNSNNTGIYLNTRSKDFTNRTNQYFGNYGETITVNKLADSSRTVTFNGLTEMSSPLTGSVTVRAGGKPLTGILKEKL